MRRSKYRYVDTSLQGGGEAEEASEDEHHA